MDKKTILKFSIAVLISSVISYKIEPFIHNNEKAIDLIINVFAILAGFLVTIMTILSDVFFDNNMNWRELTLRKKSLEIRSLKIKILFYGYMITLLSVFTSIVLSKSNNSNIKIIVNICEYVYLFTASMSFIYSIGLPNKLFIKKIEHLDKLIQDKKPKKK